MPAVRGMKLMTTVTQGNMIPTMIGLPASSAGAAGSAVAGRSPPALPRYRSARYRSAPLNGLLRGEEAGCTAAR